MRASIVIAAHNEGESLWKTIGACVETAADLGHEIIVADDASFDGSIEEAQRRFPRIRVVRHDQRLGTSPAKDLGARQARGEVLVFLDGHTNPEPGAIRRLVEDVEHLKGRAIVTPAVAALDTRRWRNTRSQVGHGYFLDLERFHCGWLPLNELHEAQEGRRKFYESPALIGCAVALGRELYEDLGGFDPHMRSWGAEDLDLGLKCWLMGHRVLHDPEAVIGHRFRAGFDNYAVPPEDFVANQLRMARKNFTHGTWSDWVDRCRLRHSGRLPDYPEGLWARVWHLFEEDRLSVEQERSYLMARRERDEFWYAGRFGLAWPRLHSSAATLGLGPATDAPVPHAAAVPLTQAEAAPQAFAMAMAVSPSPSPPPPPPEPPPTPPCEVPPQCCDCGCSSAPVRYFNGEVQLAVTDIEVGGFGKLWQHRRVYSNQLSSSGDFGNGYNWLVEQWPYLIEYGDGSITVVRGSRQTLWFDLIGGTYVGRYGAKSTLTHDTHNHLFVLALPTGEQWTFQDFDQATNPAGLFWSQQTVGGQVTQVASYTAAGRIAEIQRSTTLGGVTTTESFLYAYNGDGQAASLTLRSQVEGGAWNPIRNVVYEYYSGGESYGSQGDLKRARTQAPQNGGWADIQIYYYRYYLSSDPNGFVHGLKYVVNPNTYATMTADGLDPLSVADAVLAQYADQYLQYDSDRRVTLETLDGGSRAYTFAFTQSGNPDDYNNWAMKTVETRPDGSRNVVYTNYIGQILLKSLQSGTDRWTDYYQFDSNAHQTLAANPSAVIGLDDTSPNLGVTLNANTGLIQLTDYYTTTGSGAATGYVWREKLQQGSAGTAVVLRSYAYSSQSAGGSTVYPVSSLTVYRNDDGTGTVVTGYGYTWYAGTTQFQQKMTTLPAVSTSQNGSGISATTLDYYDTLGNKTWSMDERGFITAFVYDVPTGALAQQIDDVDTSRTTGAPAGWTTPAGGGLNLITDYQFDDLGRRTQALGPWHTIDLGGTATNVRHATWTVYQDTTYQVWTGQGYATGAATSYAFTLVNPVGITINDPSGKTLEMIQATRSSSSGPLLPTDSFPHSSYVRWTTYQYTDCCLIASQRVYHTIPSSGAGSPGTNYDGTDFGYDSMKRQNRTTTPGGTITFDVFDARDNAIATYVGTNDTGATETDPTGGGAAGNNMAVVAERQYDGGRSGGDNNLTRETQHVNATTTRLTSYLYDWLDRRTDTDGEVDFYQKDSYDNLDRVTQTDRYNTTATGHLIARSDNQYDDRGRVYQTITYGVDPTIGTIGNALTDNTWYDAANYPIKELPARSQLFIKRAYDGLGREAMQYVGYGIDNTYADIQIIDNNTILVQTESVYDAADNIIQTAQRRRYHNAPPSQTGPLGDPSRTPNARVAYKAGYADPLGRVVAAADYGTNGGAALVRPATVPASSDTVLVAATAYNDRGEAYRTTDPTGRVDQTAFDDAGRQITLVENYVDGDPTTGTPDQDRTTTRTYTPDGQIATLTAVNPATGNQTTTFVYGTTLADSDIASSELKRYETYPDSASGSDQVALTYNRQQEVTSATDQNGTVHAFDFDGLGRPTQDRITALGMGIDGAVLRIEVTYEIRGMRQTITSYGSATVGQGHVVNQARFTYNNFGQLAADYQEHSGAANVSSTPGVRYGYADGSANTIRPTSLTYPNGRVLTFDYGTSGGLDDAASRIASLIDNDGTTHLADYSYLGAATVVEVDHPQPQIRFTLIDLSGGDDPETGDIYSGFDRIGRIKDNRWHNSSSNTNADRILYGYDRAGNRLWRQDTIAESLGRGFDELYGDDGLNRLTTMRRGTLSSNQTAITGKTFAQDWSLDAAGNWSGFDEDDNGDGTWDLVQSRTSNTVNEITGITNTTGPAWATPVYDGTGNMTKVPKPDTPAQAFTATYDAWNRLVKLVDDSTSNIVQENVYDGRRFRIVRNDYTGGTLSGTRHFYYTDGWQGIEERLESAGTISSNPDRQFVWGLRYIDDLILRDRNTNGGGSLNERLYCLQDANWNVTAIADTTGNVQERYAYDAYGITKILSPTFEMRTASNYDWRNRFAGYSWDEESQSYQVRYRVFHPALGRFLTRDPMRLDTSELNLYEYVGGDPIDYLDPWGLLQQLPGQIAGGGAAAVGGAVATLPEAGATVGTIITANPVGAVIVIGTVATGAAYCFSSYVIAPGVDTVVYWWTCPDTGPAPRPEPKPRPRPVPPNPPPPPCKDTCATVTVHGLPLPFRGW